MQKRHVSSLTAVLILAMGAPATAELITMHMGGKITYSDEPVATGVEVGEDWSITYTFDSETPDLATPSGKYDKLSHNLTIGGQPWGLVGPGQIFVSDNKHDPPVDRYSQDAFLSQFGISDWPTMYVVLDDHDASVFSGTSLPLSPLPLDLFESRIFSIFDHLSYGYEIHGSVTYWTPEPTTASLLALGSCALLRRRP